MLPDSLDAECRVFTRYFIGEEPSPYVMQKYRQAHAVSPVLAACPVTRFDIVSLGLVHRFPSLVGLVDAYTSAFRKQALVRAKLILLLSLLEVSAPSYRHFDTPEPCSRVRLAALLVWRGLLSVATLLLAALLLRPIDAMCRGEATLRRPTNTHAYPDVKLSEATWAMTAEPVEELTAVAHEPARVG